MNQRFFVLILVFVMSGASIGRCDDTDEIKRLKDKIELLEAKLQLAERKNQDLNAEIEKLHAAGDDQPGTAEKEKKSLAALGTVWKGKYTGGGISQSAEAKVVARDGKTMTLETSVENGAIMQYECQFTGNDKYKITNTRRVQAAKGAINPAAVGGVTGTGTISKNKLVQNFVWKRAGEPDLQQTFNLSIVAEGKSE